MRMLRYIKFQTWDRQNICKKNLLIVPKFYDKFQVALEYIKRFHQFHGPQ